MVIRELPFDPCPLLGHPHLQTIIPAFVAWVNEPGSQSFKIALEDGDQLVLEVTTPEGWKSTDPTVLCVHGFGGSHSSTYMVRLASRLKDLGIRSIRFNARGAGSGKGLAQKVFNMNFSDDLLVAVQQIKQMEKNSPLSVIGFSLGGNVLLRMAGDLGDAHAGLLDQVIAVAPPVDLSINPSLHRSLYPGWQWCLNFYDRYFYQHVRNELLELSETLPKKWNMHLFTNQYLVATFGLGDPDRYFAQGSAIHTIHKIQIPCKILFAEDDPIVLHYLLDTHEVPNHVEIYKTKKGGHLGYLGNPFKSKGFYWLDSLLVDWVLNK